MLKTRIWRYVSALVLTIPMLGFTSCDNLSQLLHLYGFSELLPPSTLLAPGAMVTVVSRNPFKVKLVCGPRASLGPNWQPNVSSTVTRALQKHAGKTFKVSANVLESIKGNLQLSAIRDVSATLNNPKLVELEDVDIWSNLRYRSRECQRAVDARVRSGFPVTMISSGLMGDITYVVKWDNSVQLDAKAKVDALQNLAIEIGAGNSSITTDSITGTNLTYGVRDDEYLSSLTLTDVDETKVKRGSRLFPTEEIGIIDDVMHPDAPIVPPPKGKQGECTGDACAAQGLFDAGLVPIAPKGSSSKP